MYTQCSNHECEAVYRVNARTLRNAMGMVRCTKCATIFNALSTIMDMAPEGEVTQIESQLPFTEVGDRILADPQMLVERGWLRAAYHSPADHTLPPEALTADKLQQAAAEGGEDDPPPLNTRPKRHDDLSVIEENMESIAELAAKAETEPKPRSATAGDWKIFIPTKVDLLHAVKNLLRHRKRSTMGLAAIVFGVSALLLAGGFIEWNNWALRESTIQSRLGHVQITRPDYFKLGESDPFEFLMPDDHPLLQRVEALREVEAVTPRLSFTGLISFKDTTIPFKGEGVNPEKEGEVSRQLTIIEGENLVKDKHTAILGKGLAKNLGVEPGDVIALLGNPASGGMNAVEVTVAGIFQTSSKPFDDASLRVPIATAQTLLRTGGAHNFVVLLTDTSLTDSATKKIREIFADAEDFEITPWLDLAEFYKKVVVLFTAQVNLVRLIIALIIVVSISNTLIMSVTERTSEIGTLMALGLRRKRILSLFINEGVILGVLGGLIGALLGWVLSLVISHIGIPMPPSPGMDFSFKGEVMVTWTLALGGVLLGVLATIAASIYPARKASMLEIVDALRHSK